jgi:hypothetical protein
MQTPKLAVRALAAAAAVILFGYLSFNAVEAALAYEYLQSALREVARPSAPGSLSDREKWRRVRQDLTNSLRHAPLSPHALREAGLHELRGMRTRIDATPYRVYVNNAYKDFRAALTQRPASAEDWLNVALAKYYLVQWDAEMFDALRRAAELGPWEYEIQRDVLFVRLNAWPNLDQAQRAETLHIVERALRSNPAQAVPFLALHNRLDLACGTGNGNPEVQELCRRLQATTAGRASRAR